MSGRRLILGFLAVLAVFTAALIYFQFFAFYQRDQESAMIEAGGRILPARDLDRIDAETSPLKLRACFRTEPALLRDLPVAKEPTPLTPPPWFDCFDVGRLSVDIASGKAQAYQLAAGEPEGTVTIVAVYPDGRAYLWRQLAEGYAE